MEKEFKNGLCLGKFMPIHAGHINMIREAAKRCETVHVMVCSRLCEPIDGVIRTQWAKDIFKDDLNIKVIHCIDENPQYPEDDENFWQIWRDSVYKYVSDLDAVFASEDYVYKFSECLKVTPIMVDKDREQFPVSGTSIRQNPFDYWKFIPDNVKDYFRLKVCIVGPESTGKSTLVKEFGKRIGAITVHEFGREYCETEKSTDELLPEDFEIIARRHSINIKTARATSDRKILIVDTDAIITKTFLRLYYDHKGWANDPEMVKETLRVEAELDQIIRKQIKEFSFYVLMYPDIMWDDDGQRDFGEQEKRLNHFQMIKSHLEYYNVDYQIVMGKDEQRYLNVTKTIVNKHDVKLEKNWQKLAFDKITYSL
jgi:HTH-type transcriptional repressor of NAD biosynthesis genes